MRKRLVAVMTGGLVCFVGATAAVAADATATCEASKLSATAAYAQCRFKADAAAAKTGGAADYGKCSLDKFTAAEAKAGTGVCPSEADQGAVQDFLDACTSDVTTALGGGTLPLDVQTCSDNLTACGNSLSSTNADLASCTSALADCRSVSCGDGIAGAGETCDGADLNGKTCATEAASTPYGTLACSAGCGSFDTSGCRPRLVDNGDGTVTDNSTGLVWEKKVNADGVPNLSDPHDADNYYSWELSPIHPGPNGAVFLEFLATLNGIGSGVCFAGHCDWRLPTLSELQGIADAGAPGCGVSPCLDAAFGPAAMDYYWSSMTAAGSPGYALVVNFGDATTNGQAKELEFFARAVRSVPAGS